MTVSFCVENFERTSEELAAVLPGHYRELALNQDKVPLDPDWQKYFAIEREGGLLFVAGREHGELVAYFIGFVRTHIHYKTTLGLMMDIFYVLPEHRGDGTGFKLFRFVEEQARARGVKSMVVGSKLHKDASWLFERLGYTPIETFFSIWVGE